MRVCYTINDADGQVVIVKEGDVGYWPAPNVTREVADQKNAELGISHATREAMTFGSVFGWNVPIADLSRADVHFPSAKPLTERK